MRNSQGTLHDATAFLELGIHGRLPGLSGLLPFWLCWLAMLSATPSARMGAAAGLFHCLRLAVRSCCLPAPLPGPLAWTAIHSKGQVAQLAEPML